MSASNSKTIDISSGTIFRIVLIILGIWALYLIHNVVILLFFSVIIASALEPIGRWADRRGFPRMLAILFVYLAGFGVIAFGLSQLIPTIGAEIREIADEAPGYTQNITSNVQSLQEASSGYYDVVGQMQMYLGDISDRLRESASSGFGSVVQLFGGIISFLSVLVISFYLAAQRGGVQRVIRALTPRKHEVYVLDLWHRAQHKLGRWLQAQIVLGLLVGLLSWIGLTLLGIRFALTLAIIAGLLELVPYVGPVLSAIPAALVALFQAPILALYVILLYILVQQFENHVLVPAIMGKAVGLSPVTVIAALLIGGQLLGLMGIIIAVPVAAVIAEFMRDFERHRHDEEQSSRRTLLMDEE